MSKINPYSPNNPVHRDMFAGRGAELTAIDKGLLQACYGNPTHILFLGERGIGKTSLLNVGDIFAKGDFVWDDKKHNFLVARTSLNEGICLADFAVSLKNAIEREIDKAHPKLTLIKKAWSFVNRFEAAGIAFRREESSRNSSRIIQEFMYSLSDTVKSVVDPILPSSSRKEGLVILIDEADRAAVDLSLGSFLKLLTETLVAERANNILFIVCGLPGARRLLIDSHESSLRLFQEFDLGPLSKKETAEVINNGLKEFEKQSKIPIAIDPDAHEEIYVFSEGYPHFIQQIGYSVFEVDNDNHITKDDVHKGFFMEHGALELIGDRYYVKPFYHDITVESQREILTIMADKGNNWITRDEIKKKSSGKETALTNGLHALREKESSFHVRDSRVSIVYSGQDLLFG